MDDLPSIIKDYPPEKSNFLDFLKSPLLYFRIKHILKKTEQKIRNHDINFQLPRLKIRYTFKQNTSASININKNHFILKVNPSIRDNNILTRCVMHECVHLWIGHDFNTGLQFITLPHHCRLSETNNKCYLNCQESLRKVLHCFIYKKTKFENKLNNLIPIEGYQDIGFKNQHNPFITFEEVLVEYVTMKILNEDLNEHPIIKKVFDENYDDKKLLLFVENEMPNVIKSIAKIVLEFN